MIYRIFLIAILFHTPFNPFGIFPAYIYFLVLSALVVLLNSKTYKVNLWLLITIIFLYTYSLTTAAFNHDEINPNYMVAWGIVLFGYLFLSTVILQKIQRNDVDTTLGLTFKIYILISIIDYISYQFFIPLHEIFPMELRNRTVAVGLFYRLPGFYEEPTNWAGLGIGLCIYYMWSCNESNKNKAIYVVLFILILIMTRSAIAIASFIAIFGSYIVITVFTDRLRDSLMKLALFVFSLWLLLVNLEFFKLFSVLQKIQLNSNVSSVSGRLSGWNAAYSEWIIGTPIQQIFGRGLGYAELNLGSVHSWFLTLLLEQGIFGLVIVLLLIIFGITRCIGSGFQKNQAIILSFMSQFIMLISNSQFYHPLFWVLLSMMYTRSISHPARN